MTTEDFTDAVLALDGKRKWAKEIFGGKAHNLKRVSALGVPVPSAFTVSVHVCPAHPRLGQSLPEAVFQEALARCSDREGAA